MHTNTLNCSIIALSPSFQLDNEGVEPFTKKGAFNISELKRQYPKFTFKNISDPNDGSPILQVYLSDHISLSVRYDKSGATALSVVGQGVKTKNGIKIGSRLAELKKADSSLGCRVSQNVLLVECQDSKNQNIIYFADRPNGVSAFDDPEVVNAKWNLVKGQNIIEILWLPQHINR